MKIQKLIIKSLILGVLILLPLMQFGQVTCDEFVLELLSDTTVEVMRGERAYWTVRVRALVDEYTGEVRLRAYRPNGCLATWTPPDGEITPTIRQFGSVLELRTNGATPGTYTFNLAAIDEDAQIKSEVLVTLVVLEEDFEIDVTPPERQVCQGESTSYNVDLTPLNGFDSLVTLTVTGLPGGAQGTFSPNPVNPDGSSTLNITTTNSVPLGTYNLTITGTGGGKEHSRTVTFIVDNENCEDFEINVTPPERQVCQGESTSYTVNITGIMGFDSPVTLSVTGLPAGAQGTFTANPVNPDGSSTLNITTTTSVPLGTYNLTITGVGGGKEHSRTVTFIVDNENCEDFEINVTPPERQVCQGDSTSYTVNITGLMGFDSPVTLNLTGLPSGAQGTFTVNPVTPDGQSILNVTTTNSVPLGTYNLTITGVGGGKEHSRTVTFIVDNENCEDFEIEVTPGRLVVCRGDSATYTVTITGSRGFDSPVNLSLTGLPSGVSYSFNPGSVTPDGQSVLTITASASAATGTFNLTVTGIGGDKEHSVEVRLRVRNCDEPDFDIDVNPPELTVECGEEADYTVTLTSLNGFNSSVALTVTGLPDGSAATFSPDNVTPDGECQLKVTTSDSVSGVFTLTVTGSGGGKEVSVQVTLIIICETPDPSYQLDVTPDSVEVCRGLSASYTVNLTSLEGFHSPVDLSVSGLPAGAAAGFSENPVTPTGSCILDITTTDETPFGSYTITIQGDSGGLIKEDTVTLTIIDSRFSVQIEAEPITGSAPLTVKFEALITSQGEFPLSQYSFHWHFGDGSTSQDRNPEHTYDNPGTFNVTLDVTGPCGQSETAALEIIGTSEGGDITKTFSQSEVQPGDEVTMTITAVNNTDYHFENVVIRDTLSQYLEYLDDDASVEPIQSGRELKWKFSRLRKGESLTINVKLRVSMDTPPGKIVNIATLSYDNLKKEIPSDPAELIVYKIEVLLEKSVDKTIANPGEHIKYQLTLTNNSSIPLTNIKVSDMLSSHLEFISQSGALDFSIEGQNIQYTGTLDPGQSVVISIEALVKTETLGGTVIENCAVVEADQLNEEVKSNCVTTTVPDNPAPPINVRFIKRADIPQTSVGRIIGFTLTIINESAVTLQTPTIEDYFPQGFNYITGSTLLNGQPFNDPQGKRRVVWQLPDIKPHETVVLRYQVVIGADVRRGININRAWLHSGDLLLEASDIVNVSGPGIIFYCGLEGFVYLDNDCNGVYNYGDTPLEGIEIRLSSGEKAVTDKFGHYIFEDLYPGDYVVSVNPHSLPDMYIIAGDSPTLVVLSEGLTDSVNFGLKYNSNSNAISNAASLELEAVCPEAREASKLKGQPFTLKFIISNTGNSDLYHVVIKDTLPQYFQYVPGSSRLDDSTTADPEGMPGPSLEWQLGILGKGRSKTFLFQAAADIDIKATIYKNQAHAEAVIACAKITTPIEECKLAIYEGPGCCPQIDETGLSSFAKPEGPLSFIEPYFHTETAMFTVYAVFNLWADQALEKGCMPLFMKERLQNYALSTVEEFYLNSQMGVTLPDRSIRLSFAGAYPEKDPETKERKWLRKQVDETMTVSQIAWELLGLNEAVKKEKQTNVKNRLETIIKEKLIFMEEFINNIEDMPHGWEITRQAKTGEQIEDKDNSYKLKRLQDKASPYDKASLYLAMVELGNSGYNKAEDFCSKIRASLAAQKIDDKSFLWSHRHAEFMFILALLENGEKDAAAAKIKVFEELLKQGLVLNDLHTYTLAAAVDKKAGGTLYEGIAAKMKKKFYLEDTGIFADKQPDFTFKVSLKNIAPLLLFFDNDTENMEHNAITMYRTFDEVGIFLKKRSLKIGKQPLYSLIKNYPFGEPLLPILSFTMGDRSIAPVFSKDAVVHTSRVKPLGERLIPDTFSKILSPAYETSISRIAALSFQLQDFAKILMFHQEPVIREEGRSFAFSGRKYVETLLKSGAGITKNGNLLLPYDHLSIKGNGKGELNLEPMNVKQVFSTGTLSNYLLAEKRYVDGAGKQAETVSRSMEFQTRIVEELLKDGVPETFRVFIESDTQTITVTTEGQASKITAAKLLLLYPGNSVLKSTLNKPGEKLEPEDLLFLSRTPELVPYFEKEIKEVIDREDSKITHNAADILGRYLLRQTDHIGESLENLLKHWDKDTVLPRSDQVETIERGIIYHHQPQHLLLYLSALQPSSPEAPVSFRFERTLNILTYLLETEWGLFGNSVDKLPSSQYLVFKEQPSEYFQAGDLINIGVRLENNCARGLGSAGYNPSFFIKAWFNPALVYYGTQFVEGLSVLGDFLWSYGAVPEGKVMEYTYQVFVPYGFRSGSIEGGIALRSRMGYEDFGPETAGGIICEETGQLGSMKIIPLQEIPGLVFEDRNGNGKKDADEPGIPNILIKESRGPVLDGDTKDRVLRSDAQGRFRIFARDQHEGVQLELSDLPAQYVLLSEPTRLVNRNYSGEIYFPLVPCRTVTGVVIDNEKNIPVEGVLLKFKVQDLEKEVFSGKDGEFIFRNVPIAWEDSLIEINKSQPFYKGSAQNLKFKFNKPSVINK